MVQTAEQYEDPPSIILIGMPGCGKSTVGPLLARAMNLDFLDTDDLVQSREGQTLPEILATQGYLRLREIEECVVMGHSFDGAVVATGGSVIYSGNTMSHFRRFGRIVYLKTDIRQLNQRLGSLSQRGVAAPLGTTLFDLELERTPLYERAADLIVSAESTSVTQTLKRVIDALGVV